METVAHNAAADDIQCLLAEFDGELAWDLIARVEVLLGKLALQGPTGRTRTAVAAFSHRVKALERWLVRASETLRHKEGENGFCGRTPRSKPASNGSPP